MCATCVLAQFAPCVPPAGHTCATCATCVLPQFLPCVPPACCPSLRHVYVRTTSVAHMCHVCHLRAAPACASLRVRTYVGACVRAHVPARMRTHARCAGKSPRARGHAYVRSFARTYVRVVRTYVRTYVRVGRHTYARTLPNACGREIRTYVRTYVAALGPERKEQFPLRIHQSSPCEAAGPRQVRTYVPYTRTYVRRTYATAGGGMEIDTTTVGVRAHSRIGNGRRLSCQHAIIVIRATQFPGQSGREQGILRILSISTSTSGRRPSSTSRTRP